MTGAGSRDTRADVLIHPKEIRGIVLVLEGDKAFVLRPIGSAYSLLALVTEIVHIDRIGEERVHGVPETSGPRDVGLGVGGIPPHGGDEQVVWPAAVAEGCRVLCDPAHRAIAVVLENAARLRGRRLGVGHPSGV